MNDEEEAVQDFDELPAERRFTFEHVQEWVRRDPDAAAAWMYRRLVTHAPPNDPRNRCRAAQAIDRHGLDDLLPSAWRELYAPHNVLAPRFDGRYCAKHQAEMDGPA